MKRRQAGRFDNLCEKKKTRWRWRRMREEEEEGEEEANEQSA